MKASTVKKGFTPIHTSSTEKAHVQLGVGVTMSFFKKGLQV